MADRYELVRILGSGGMGTVWLASDTVRATPCAIKLLDPKAGANPAVRSRFAREARMAARAQSANVVVLHAEASWRGVPFIVMEYLDGEDLGARLKRSGRLDAESTYAVVAQVANALTHAHAAGVIHRDIKPANVFIASQGELELVKLLDFGVAKPVLPEATEPATCSGMFLGTMRYASPEQLRGGRVDWRSDLWSLAVLAFECLTGAPAFGDESIGALCGRILYDPLPSITAGAHGFSQELEAWWRRALSREPQARFQSAKELADALAEALGLGRVDLPSLPPRPERLADSSNGPSRRSPRVRVAELFRRRLVQLGMAFVLGAGVASAWGTLEGNAHAGGRVVKLTLAGSLN